MDKFWQHGFSLRRLHFSIVHNPSMSKDKNLIGGFVSRVGFGFCATLRIKSIFINFDWV